MKLPAIAALLLAAFGMAPANATEIFGGVYQHDVETPLGKSGDIERGDDVQLGLRGGRIAALRAIGRPQPYVMGMVNSAGGADFAVAGLSWRIGDEIYVRPAIGLAVHSNPSRPNRPDRIDFGSRVLFAPEIGLGFRVSKRLDLEANLVHFSHAQLFGPQNPGLDNIGLRVGYRF